MDIPVIDIVTDEVKTVNASDVAYVQRTGKNGSVLKLLANGIEYRMLSNTEWLKHLSDSEIIIKSDVSTFINPTKVTKFNSDEMVAEFDNGKQANVARSAMKNVQSHIEKTK